ncbi:MbtH family protein [Micromonospora sp. NPDC002296]|uniref:MbtH family protein n=1 Tax=Micromonospora sp. NPDC002296 TaxID=3154271 RepID=UPI0033205D94
MRNPFDDEDSTFLVLVNDRNEHSLWPSKIPVPDGWRVVLEESDRATAVTYVEENWRDLDSVALQG